MPRDTAEIVSLANAGSARVETLEPTIFAHRGAGKAVVLTWDRAGLTHVATIHDYRTVGRTFEASDGWETKPRIVDWSTFNGDGEAA